MKIHEVLPNRWYTLGDIFGQSLSYIARQRLTRRNTEVKLLSATSIDSPHTSFRGGSLSLILDYHYTDRNNLYILKEPSEEDLDVQNKAGQIGSLEFAQLSINIEPVWATDVSSMIKTKVPGQFEGDYRFKMLLRSYKGIFLSEDRAETSNNKRNGAQRYSTRVLFSNWRHETLDQGHLYIPLDPPKLSILELMAQSKQP